MLTWAVSIKLLAVSGFRLRKYMNVKYTKSLGPDATDLTMGVEPEGGVASIQGHGQRPSAVHSFLQSFLIVLWHKCISLQRHLLTRQRKLERIHNVALSFTPVSRKASESSASQRQPSCADAAWCYCLRTSHHSNTCLHQYGTGITSASLLHML